MVIPATDIDAPPPTRWVIKLGYASGNLGKSVIWASFESFMLFYLVSVLGMEPLIAGSLLALMLVWDGLADLGIAYWTDHRGRADMLGRLILIGAPMTAFGFWAIFAAKPEPQGLLTALAIVLCRMGYTLCDVGHNTLLVRVAVHPSDAASVSGWRLIFSAIGGGLVGLASAQSLTGSQAEQKAAFDHWAGLASLLYLGTLLIAMLVSRSLPSAPRARSKDNHPFQTLWANRRYGMVLGLMVLQSCLTPLFTRALPFFGLAMHGDASWAGRALSLITLAQALSLPLWMTLSQRWSSAMVLALSHALLIVAMAGVALAAGATIDLAGLLLLGLAQGGMNMAIWALLADSLRHGAGSETLPMGLFLAGIKCSAGLGNAIFATMVELNGQPCATCRPQSTHWLETWIMGIPIFGSLTILAIIAMHHRRLKLVSGAVATGVSKV
ncbi:hypothetical protein EOE18_17280 [Novosphingobium umbonatum]|uniref:MFS transporter n=1 Tax=Novosphingobium umbonatum TaxID=1908524 RepID=A0A437MXB8_9SPHN|nr:MFS transporter [Novosphingobium umbonatum]RVU02314.1 hypothetical protein EOE18_17280 [Novosphingobium umbonatum]